MDSAMNHVMSECVRCLNVGVGDHIGISPLAKEKVKLKSDSVRVRKFVLEFKESLLIMRDKISLNRNIKSALLYLFNRIYLRLTPLLGSSVLGFF